MVPGVGLGAGVVPDTATSPGTGSKVSISRTKAGLLPSLAFGFNGLTEGNGGRQGLERAPAPVGHPRVALSCSLICLEAAVNMAVTVGEDTVHHL